MQDRSGEWDHCLDYAALSDVGLRRANNQDSYAVALAADQTEWTRRGHFFIVADGMGAHAAGELASKLSADHVLLNYQKSQETLAPGALAKAIQDTNQLIYERGQSDEDFRGMGTTTTALALLPQGALVGHVGDSRAYRVRGQVIEQLTFDHSLVWELRAAGQPPPNQGGMYVPKNIITRSLGPNPTVQVDLEGPFPLQIGDTFLICSDGLTGQVTDKEIGAILHSMPPKKAARVLVDLANLRGGPDNITLVVVRVIGSQQSRGPATVKPSEAPAKSASPAGWIVAGTLAVLGVILFALGQATLAVGAWSAGAIAALVAMVWRGAAPTANGDSAAVSFDHYGRAPYVQATAVPDREVVDVFSSTLESVVDAAVTESVAVEGPALDQFRSEGAAAAAAGRMADAVRCYCEGITYVVGKAKGRS